MVFQWNCSISRPTLRGKEKKVEQNMSTLFLQLTQVLMSQIVGVLRNLHKWFAIPGYDITCIFTPLDGECKAKQNGWCQLAFWKSFKVKPFTNTTKNPSDYVFEGQQTLQNVASFLLCERPQQHTDVSFNFVSGNIRILRKTNLTVSLGIWH